MAAFGGSWMGAHVQEEHKQLEKIDIPSVSNY